MSNPRDKGCIWLSNGLYMDPSPRHNQLSFKSCCAIGDVPGEFLDRDRSAIIFNHDDMIALQNNPDYNYDNLKHTACRKCYESEAITGRSMRTTSYGKISTVSSAERERRMVDLNGRLVHLQITFSSFCNLKCTYCGPDSSTTWEQHIQEFPAPNTVHWHNKKFLSPVETYNHEQRVIDFLRTQDLSRLRSIGIFGGEPFMARKFNEFIELLHQNSKPERIKVQINTNATVFPKPHIVEILQDFKQVEIRGSVEATGDLAEYIRSGLNWQVFEQNCARWASTPGIDFYIHCAHTVCSINRVSDLATWLAETGYRHKNGYTYTPEYVDIRRVLPPECLAECADIVSKTPYSGLTDYLMGYLTDSKYDPAVSDRFKTYMRYYDSHNVHTLQQVNPALYGWLNKN